MFLTKEQILESDDLSYRDVEVPEWGGTVRIKTMTGGERDEFESSVYDSKGKDIKVNLHNFRAKLISKTLVDDKGQRLFSDSEVEILSKKSSKALDRVYQASQELNAIGQKEVDELTKN